jgi:hypothetical protein
MQTWRNSPSREPFPRDRNGLVDLECYLPYLVDYPSVVPLYLPFNHPARGINWLRQHVYFQERNYRQEGVPPEDKDWNLVHWRNAPYNQLIMRPQEEQRLHRDFEEHVDAPPAETISACLNEYEIINKLGAASLGKTVLLQPEHSRNIFQIAKLEGTNLSVDDRVDIYNAQIDESLRELHSSTVTPHRIVTSALRRLAILVNDTKISKEAIERSEGGEDHFPLRMPKTQRLLDLSHTLLKDAVDSKQREIGVEAIAA